MLRLEEEIHEAEDQLRQATGAPNSEGSEGHWKRSWERRLRVILRFTGHVGTLSAKAGCNCYLALCCFEMYLG